LFLKARTAIAVAIALFFAAPAFAQQSVTSASISGRVTDPSGAPVPGASVTATEIDRNQVQTVVTSADGHYRFVSLAVGRYELSASIAGLSSRRLALTLAIGDALDLPLSLGVDSVSDTVDVVGDLTTLDSRRTQLAETITPREIDSLPLNGRNYLDLALLAPGVSRTVQRNTERFAETSAVPGTGISIAGQRNLNNTFIVDGVSANDDAAGLAGPYLSEEVVREFQVITSGGVAEFGRASSGIVNIITQSGTNSRRGRAYGFFRNDAMDARNALSTRKDPLTQAQYGVTFSGPVVRNRTFWFANAERTSLDRTGLVTIAATDAARINAVLDTDGFGGPRVQTGEFATGYDTNNLFVRIDNAFSGDHTLAVRGSLYDVSSENARNAGGLNATSRGTALDNGDATVALNWMRTVGSGSLNELRGQATHSALSAPPNDLAGPAVTINGAAAFGTSTSSPTERTLGLFELSDSYTAQRGEHLLKAGGSWLYERLDIDFPGALQGAYTFQSVAAFETGRYLNFQQAFGRPSQFQTNANVTLFAQDEWRPTGSVTVNAGLRYDLQFLADIVDTDTDNLSPRIGLAFAPRGGRTVIRASAGLYYDRIPLRAISNALQRDGINYQVALVTFGEAAAPVFPHVLGAFPSGIVTNITSIDPQIQNAVARQGHVGVEHQFGRHLTVTAGYLHLTGRQIIMSRNLNVPTLTPAEAVAAGIANLGRPDPRYGNNGQFQGIGQARFDGLTASAQIRGIPGSTLRLAYTLSKAMDDAGNAFFSSPQDNGNVHDDWGPSDNDQRHRLVLSGSATAGRLFTVAGLFSYSSAPPFNVQTGNDRNNDTNVNDRPIGVGRNSARGFDNATLDLRINRAFTLPRGHAIEAIVDIFNLLNRSNFLIPNNTRGTSAVPTASFGRPTAAADPRQVQLGIRWSF
jgi:hypothetical protein